MAINIEWQVKPPNKGTDDGKPQMFPRITDSEVINEQRLAEMIANRGVLSRGNVLTAINDMIEAMAELLKEGKTIDIPSLGAFKLAIGTDAQIHPDSSKRMQSIVVRGVNFQPAQQFMNAIGHPCFLWRPSTGMAIAPTSSQLVSLLVDYFKAHDSITRAEFARVFRLKRTTAYCRLKELMEMGVIQAIGGGRETKYVKII